MDFGFSEEQGIIKKEVRAFLTKENPKDLVREIEEKQLDYSLELYRKLADLGWLGLMIPEEYGGVGGNWIDIAIFCEEAGHALLQSPYLSTVVQSAQAILAFGTDSKKRELLPRIAKGDVVMSLALSEIEAGSNTALITTSAIPDGESFMLNGTKSFISYAHVADLIIVVAKTTDEKSSLFLVEKGAKGLVCNPINTLDGERVCEVVLNEVRIPRSNLLSELNEEEDTSEIIEKSKIALCAEAVGVAQVALEMATAYAKRRVQFGVPIGSFQAIQHKLADMLIALEGARWISYYVACLQSERIPCARERAMAILQAGEASRYITAEAMQVHGGTGAMEIEDIGLYFRRAKGIQLRLGYPHMYKDAICSAMGL